MRAPSCSGEYLNIPAWDALPDVVTDNMSLRQEARVDVLGAPLTELAASARNEAIRAAAEYTAQYSDVSVPQEFAGPLLLTGHQPELFHSGVWLKNFALDRLAKRCGGVGIQLIIDGDQVRSPSVLVPTGSLTSPRTASIAYDLPLQAQPYEQRPIRDRATLANFPAAVENLLEGLIDQPLVHELFSYVVQRVDSNKLGLAIAQGRHQLERAWGNDTLELPQSMLCQLPSVRHFLIHLLVHLPRFVSAYNAALASFRSRHRIRNAAQPVPDLHQFDDWREAPLWIWSNDDPTRRPLYSRQLGDELELTDRAEFRTKLFVSHEPSAASAIEQWQQLQQRGIKIRTRATTTTMVARMLLSDMFIHGIGGARYDEVTDDVISRFFHSQPPQFATVTGTLHLPLPVDRQTRDLQYSQRQLRDFHYHPERHADDVNLPPAARTQVDSLIERKHQWIRTRKTPDNARNLHLAIEQINASLRELLVDREKQLQSQHVASRQQQRAQEILTSREFAFCLFPAKTIKPFLLAEF